MKMTGGYNVPLTGRPAAEVEVPPEPDVLHLPLWSRRFSFSDVCVAEGQRVEIGEVLAIDPANYCVPLLAPRSGTVRLDRAPKHITLEHVRKESEEPLKFDEAMVHVPRLDGAAGMQRYKLLMLGAWQFLRNAHTGELPDPFGSPSAVLVITVHLEPFLARGDVQIHKRLFSLIRGLEHLQSLLEYQPIYLVMPDLESDFARRLRELLRGYAHVKLVLIPLRYGLEHPAVLARHLDLRQEPGNPVWALGVEGLLAIDRALTARRSCDVRIVSVGGSAAGKPRHLKVMPGYPLRPLLLEECSELVRVINGGVMTGQQLCDVQMGLDTECTGLTLLPQDPASELLGFMRPGWKSSSYSRCFASTLRKPFAERFTTGLRGEGRACISCGLCERVCPARIEPHVIHKFLYRDALEEAELAGLKLCVRCGLCSFVCPSKIELREQFVEAQQTVKEELEALEAQA